MQPFVFSVTQLEINFSHQQWSCVKVYLNKLVKLKITFSHSNLENNFWFENAKQQLCFFYYCCCYLNIKLLKNVLFPNMHFWCQNLIEFGKNHFWTEIGLSMWFKNALSIMWTNPLTQWKNYRYSNQPINCIDPNKREDRTLIFIYLGKINLQRTFSYQLCM